MRTEDVDPQLRRHSAIEQIARCVIVELSPAGLRTDTTYCTLFLAFLVRRRTICCLSDAETVATATKRHFTVSTAVRR